MPGLVLGSSPLDPTSQIPEEHSLFLGKLGTLVILPQPAGMKGKYQDEIKQVGSPMGQPTPLKFYDFRDSRAVY